MLDPYLVRLTESPPATPSDALTYVTSPGFPTPGHIHLAPADQRSPLQGFDECSGARRKEQHLDNRLDERRQYGVPAGYSDRNDQAEHGVRSGSWPAGILVSS